MSEWNKDVKQSMSGEQYRPPLYLWMNDPLATFDTSTALYVKNTVLRNINFLPRHLLFSSCTRFLKLSPSVE